MKKLYIITGAAGHLAGAIMRLLEKEDCLIRGLVLPCEEYRQADNATYVEGDVTKSETLDALFEGAGAYDTTVFHLAGLISIAKDITPALYDVNVNGTKNIIAKCFEYQVGRLVYVSSVHAIPEAPGGVTITETREFSKDMVTGAYAKTKAEATAAVLEAAERGLNAVVVLPSGIIGPYDEGRNHMVQMIADYVAGRLPAGVAGGYDFVDVRDVAQGCLLAAKKGSIGQCYILSNRYCTIKDLFAYIRLVVRSRPKPCVPIWLARAVAPLFTLIGKLTHTRPLYTRYALRTLEKGGLFSHDKATRELGFKPRDLKSTVADTVRWLRTGQCESG